MAEVKEEACMKYAGFAVPMALHAENRKKLVSLLKNAPDKSFIYIQGGTDTTRYSADTDNLFRQESFFFYLFGVNEPDFAGAIDVSTGKSFLFMPRLAERYEIWCGRRKTPAENQARFAVDNIAYGDEIADVLKKAGCETLLVNVGTNSDSDKETQPGEFKGMEEFKQNKELLHPALIEARSQKSALEIALMRRANEISSLAYIHMMRTVAPGKKEYEVESQFLYQTYARGQARYQAYVPICASGPNSSILHYGHAGAPNDREMKDGELILLDMGCELHCYASDLTRTIPVSGKFSEKQKGVYETVLMMQEAVEKTMKAGVMWSDMHKLAYRILAERLIKLGFTHDGVTVEDLLKNHIPAIFMPHGLGHMIGIDVHDVGGYPKGVERPTEPGIDRLRTNRVLKEGMALTVEPGFYFIDALLVPKLADPQVLKFLKKEVVESYRGFGGVRIEDDVIVTKDGIYNLTTAPKTVADIEKVMSERGNAAGQGGSNCAMI